MRQRMPPITLPGVVEDEEGVSCQMARRVKSAAMGSERISL